MIAARALSMAVLLCAAVQASAQTPVQIDMSGTSIIGDQELPNVLYVVPWKDSEPVRPAAQDSARSGDMLPGPVRRSVMQRQLRYRMDHAGDPGAN